ncbi:hypothetical protein PsorP6_012957 [Peronosclerospora sorghi]|uniref:Uncharacterized protein n=1 Tax=Peronosclerospora sorghi TaxID=230839 RepID=A0ACC0WI09_9STRA|nr:hypothetical protein PsorP6_012957 [Peronosclerospora sorghi]
MLECHLTTKDSLLRAAQLSVRCRRHVASDGESRTTVAIKKFTNAFHDLPDMKRILRELCLLRQLKHLNLIHLYDIPLSQGYLHRDGPHRTDLHRVIHSTQTLTDEHAYLHSVDIFHRDLKPSNVLVTSTCDTKFGDLGLALYVDYCKGKAMKVEMTFVELTEYVVTRWYRAPEIILDGCRYDKPSDLRYTGCILAELQERLLPVI